MMDQDNPNTNSGPAAPDAATLRTLSPLALATLGTGHIAYVKPVTVDEQTAYAVHGADGSPLAMVATRDVAFALVRQNDLEPVSVH